MAPPGAGAHARGGGWRGGVVGGWGLTVWARRGAVRGRAGGAEGGAGPGGAAGAGGPRRPAPPLPLLLPPGPREGLSRLARRRRRASAAFCQPGPGFGPRCCRAVCAPAVAGGAGRAICGRRGCVLPLASRRRGAEFRAAWFFVLYSERLGQWAGGKL